MNTYIVTTTRYDADGPVYQVHTVKADAYDFRQDRRSNYAMFCVDDDPTDTYINVISIQKVEERHVELG